MMKEASSSPFRFLDLPPFSRGNATAALRFTSRAAAAPALWAGGRARFCDAPSIPGAPRCADFWAMKWDFKAMKMET